ncbi:MAG: ycgJ 3 [Verrucomicrobiaceae bacterium]|nr:ycgJ 3 [Verrucomicrobiaceae bacterium]
MTDIHRAAQQGFSQEAATYARGRPEYPDTILPWLKRELDIDAGDTVVDLGAGTGKFTKLLLQTDASIIAVEPVAAMRVQFEETFPTVKILVGNAQAIPLPDNSANAVVCAQAFHWFATVEALREIHRTLRPDGKLGLIWNVRDEATDWVAALDEIMHPYEGDAPRFISGEWRRPFSSHYFSPLQQTTFSHRHVGAPQAVIIDRSLSISFIAALPAAEKSKVKTQLQTLIATHPALRDKDEIVFPYYTAAYWCSRLNDPQ